MSQRMAILTDTTLCTGCEECVEACKKENRLGKDVPRRWKLRIDDLSSTRFTTIVRARAATTSCGSSAATVWSRPVSRPAWWAPCRRPPRGR